MTTSFYREAYRLVRSGQPGEALSFAERAAEGRQRCGPEHALLATILLQLDRIDDAHRVLSHAAQLEAEDAHACDALAFVSTALGMYEQTNTLYRRATLLSPKEPRFWYNLASSERGFGRLLEAEAACERAIALDPRQYPSYLLRSELRTQTFAANHVEELQRQLAGTGANDRARIFLAYALAKELDDLQDYEGAFRWFAQAANARRRHLSYDVAVDERKLQRIADCFTGGPPALTPPPPDSSRYVFIVGLPRSGTTLLERILTGLPGVRSNGETENFARALLAAAPREGPTPAGSGSDVFRRAADSDPRDVAERYAQLANRSGPADRIMEKLPMNYLYLGAIHRALPAASIVLVRRSAPDSCFAMYRTLFGEAYPFSYDFEDLARYFAAYDRLIRHWRSILGGSLREIDYEELVSEPARTSSRIASHIGVPWHESALEIEKNSGVSVTASAAQIRRPIYRSSSGRWRHYRRHLVPLIEALRRQGVGLPHDA